MYPYEIALFAVFTGDNSAAMYHDQRSAAGSHHMAYQCNELLLLVVMQIAVIAGFAATVPNGISNRLTSLMARVLPT